MAVAEYRTLTIDDVRAGEITVKIEGLDAGYTATTRTIVWTCYKGTSEQGKVVEQFNTTLTNGYDAYDHTFYNLQPNTDYYMTARISNIKGLSGDVVYRGGKRTLNEVAIEVFDVKAWGDAVGSFKLRFKNLDSTKKVSIYMRVRADTPTEWSAEGTLVENLKRVTQWETPNSISEWQLYENGHDEVLQFTPGLSHRIGCTIWYTYDNGRLDSEYYEIDVKIPPYNEGGGGGGEGFSLTVEQVKYGYSDIAISFSHDFYMGDDEPPDNYTLIKVHQILDGDDIVIDSTLARDGYIKDNMLTMNIVTGHKMGTTCSFYVVLEDNIWNLDEANPEADGWYTTDFYTSDKVEITFQSVFMAPPLINEFTVQSIDDKGTIRVYCKFENAYLNGISSDEGWTDFWVYTGEKEHDICFFVLSEYPNGLTFDGDYYTYEAEIEKAGTPGETYTYTCVITNSYQEEAEIQEYECSPMFVTITLHDEIKCELPIFLAGSGLDEEKQSSNDNRVQYRLIRKPIIMAADWNQFCDDVNAVRRMSGYPDKITDIYVEKGALMTASLFNKLYEAIADIYLEGFGLPEMPDNTFIQTRYKTDDLVLFIPRLCNVLLGLRDYYQSTRID